MRLSQHESESLILSLVSSAYMVVDNVLFSNYNKKGKDIINFIIYKVIVCVLQQ